MDIAKNLETASIVWGVLLIALFLAILTGRLRWKNK